MPEKELKMTKYDVRFCKCGRVHFIENEKLEKVCSENEKEILFICNHCGASSIIGLEDYMDGKAWYSYSVTNTEISDVSRIGLIIASRGEMIIMQTGSFATYLSGGLFIDSDTPKPDEITTNEWENKRKIVDTQRTINQIRDIEKVEALSHYGVHIDWKGTLYEKKYK